MSSQPITPLSFCVMPSRFVRRDEPHGFSEWDDTARSAFDDDTLFYDVFQSGAPGRIYAVGPPLKRAFRTFLKQSQFSLNGVPATYREISQSRRACMLEITADVADPAILSIINPHLSLNIAIGSSHLDRYFGRRTMFTLSRNNDLKWVRDWAQFHIETQGVDAILLFDNASDHYGADALLEVLAGVRGLVTYDVVPAPFQYGPVGNGRDRTNARFLQFGVFEITRLRFLQHATGALNLDIDEMAHTPKGTNVFDAAIESDSGFLTLPGSWRYPEKGAPLCHSSHVLRATQDDAPMYPKWCIDPSGSQLGKSWRTHGIKGLPDQVQDDCGFFHCRMISESWHYDRSEYSALSLEADPVAERLLGETLTAPAA